MHTKRQMTYFTADGWYGDTEDIIIYDTTAWTEGQWIDIQRSAQDQRIGVAKLINEINTATSKQGESK
jgi:hypothetical protein